MNSVNCVTLSPSQLQVTLISLIEILHKRHTSTQIPTLSAEQMKVMLKLYLAGCSGKHVRLRPEQSWNRSRFHNYSNQQFIII